MKFDPLYFISSGVACYAISLIESIGILEKIQKQKKLHENVIFRISDHLSIKKALMLLESMDILQKKNKKYSLTNFGYQIIEHIGSIGLIYNGYRNILASQIKIILNKVPSVNRLIDGKAVAHASMKFGEHITSIVINFVKQLNIKGDICDLGCGSADRLLKICKEVKTKGLGIEIDDDAIKYARKMVKNENIITIEKGDITNLKKIWKNTTILMQYFVAHDIDTQKCILMMNSYLKSFPSFKYFFFVDAVSSSQKTDPSIPGFDYIHGLLNIPIRTYEETLKMFDKSKYKIFEEVPIKKLPNVFLWILQPRV